MAATTAAEKSEVTDDVSERLQTSNPDSGSGSEDSEELQDYVVDFLQNEVGGDLKSLKKVGELLERLGEETHVLEEQVSNSRHFQDQTEYRTVMTISYE